MRPLDGEDKKQVCVIIGLKQVAALGTWLRDFDHTKVGFFQGAPARRHHVKDALQQRARYCHAEKLLHEEVLSMRRKGRRVSAGFVCHRKTALARQVCAAGELPAHLSWVYRLTTESAAVKKELAAGLSARRDW